MRAVVFAFLLCLCGCATTVDNGYVTRMNSMVGLDEKALITRMGVPDKSYEVDRFHKALAYTTRRDRFVDSGPGFGLCGGGFNRGFGYSACHDDFPRQMITETCEVTFLVTNGAVAAWQQRGNACPRIQ